ncbi:MAG TPA: response regulator [Polyangia bacterium]
MARTGAIPGNGSLPEAERVSPGDILLVDDNPANLVAIEAALEDLTEGIGVYRAHSGPEALRLLLERDFALILLDVNMPSMNGFDTARLIRERKRSRHTPIIFVTAYSRDDREILAAYELGAVDFLFKPVVPEMLRAKASVFVELQRRTAEVANQAELLRDRDRLLHEQRLQEERRRWEEMSLRRQRDEAQRAAEALTLKTQELAATIEEKERIERALIDSNRELEAADRRKDEFLAVLGHELRNPLAPLVTGLALLDRGLQLSPIQVERLQHTRATMERQVKYLARLVDDLLDVSRIHSGKIELRKETASLEDVVNQAIAAVKPALDQRKHELVTRLPSTPTTIYADVVRLTQVLANLLNNAIRYTEDGGRITLECDQVSDWLEVHITDNGRGIPADLLPQIFDMFVQERAGGGGLGLGLTLVERLVALHGGSVIAHSEGPGKGARFTIRVPVRGSGEFVAVTPPTSDASVLPPATPSGSEPKIDESATVGAPRRLSVVLVEDNADVRETMCELLTVWGHGVQMAVDGPSGVELILSAKPDLALVDLGLPGFDGYTVASEVRKHADAETIHLVAMSGFGQESDRRRSKEVGFNAHLVKPADMDALLEVLSKSAER